MPYDWNKIINETYPVDRKVRGILLSHSRSVSELAKHIAETLNIDVDYNEIEAAAMLHDIGIIKTNAPGIDCFGQLPYLCHGAVGADIIRSYGAPEYIARVAERHTGAGLTAEEIEKAGLPLPAGRIYMPQTCLERLICYSDCFYSKGGDGTKKTLDRVQKSMDKFGQSVRSRFDKLHDEFGKGNI